jgi:hypothetical protein
MNDLPFNNDGIAQFFTGSGTYQGGNRSNLGAMRMRKRGMGAIGASSTSAGPGTATVPTAGNAITTDGLSTTASSVASLTTSATSLVKGILGAESAQNAINAQKNLTAALTPGVLTLIIGVIAYALVTKK